MGTEVMAIGASKNNQPIKSGLVAMIGPLIDTIIVCTITGLVILLSSEWIEGTYSGVSLTQKSFSNYLGLAGDYILIFSVATFTLSQCLDILIMAANVHHIYLVLIQSFIIEYFMS